MILDLETARVYQPLIAPSRYKGAHGGRGSGKSHQFAQKVVKFCVKNKGARILCGRQVQKSLKESAMQLVTDKIARLKAPGFDVQRDLIKTPGGGIIVFQGLATHNADTIKSYEGFDVAWIEQAETLSVTSLEILRPTLRKAGSELWFTWNPRRRSDPVDKLLRGEHAKDLDAIVVQANWRDNPWWPDVLERERSLAEIHEPDTYAHIWEGDYAGVYKGAYFADSLAKTKREGRITRLAIDPLMQIKTFWDLRVGDATAIWIAQWIGKEIRVLDYIESEGQPLAYYVAELRHRGYDDALCVLPHDGAHRDSVRAVRFEDHLKDAGFKTQVVTNQGAGAARLRIEAARRLFPSIWFDDTKTQAGREALGAYHERRDEDRDIGLGPEHDWASHGADAFGLMCVAYEEPRDRKPRRLQQTVTHDAPNTGWMRA